MHKAQGRRDTPLGHWGRGPLQPARPRPRPLQVPPFRESTEHRPLRDRGQRKLLDREVQGFGGGRNEQKEVMQTISQQQTISQLSIVVREKYPIWAYF